MLFDWKIFRLKSPNKSFDTYPSSACFYIGL